MRFRIVILADLSVFRGTGSVEISKRCKAQPMGDRQCLEYVLDIEFGLAVRIDRRLRGIFMDGQ